MEENLKIPNHVAIILDGNGRWAKAKGMPRNYGHMQGAKTVEVICEEVGSAAYCFHFGGATSRQAGQYHQ